MSFPKDKKITVIHCSHWSLMRRAIREHVCQRKGVEFIGEAANGRELFELLEKRLPDVVVLDIQMPVNHGDILPVLREQYPCVKVIILTILNDPEFILKALELGVTGYLTTDVGSDTIYNAIISSHSTGFFLSERARRSLEPSFDSISEIEKKLILALARNSSRERIAVDANLSPATVSAITVKLMMAANVYTTEELVDKARELEYI